MGGIVVFFIWILFLKVWFQPLPRLVSPVSLVALLNDYWALHFQITLFHLKSLILMHACIRAAIL